MRKGVLPPTVGAHGVWTGLTVQAVVSCLREVTHLPLFKILAYIDFGQGEFVLPPTMYELGRESISAEDTLCFGAHRVWIRVRGGYVTFEWNYKPTPIETYRNRADGLCVAGIGSSNFHLADFGVGRLLRLSPLFSNFAECMFTVPTQFASHLYSTIFFGRDPFSIGITFYIHHFCIYTFKSTTKNSAPLYV